MVADENTEHGVPAQAIILFDGVCVMCSRWYRFVYSRDRSHRVRFVAIQEPEGRAIAERCGIDPDDPATFALVEHGAPRLRSDAALRIIAQLPGWRWTGLLRVIPAGVRDCLYDFVARNRYRWFGRLDTCSVRAATAPPVPPPTP